MSVRGWTILPFESCEIFIQPAHSWTENVKSWGVLSNANRIQYWVNVHYSLESWLEGHSLINIQALEWIFINSIFCLNRFMMEKMATSCILMKATQELKSLEKFCQLTLVKCKSDLCLILWNQAVDFRLCSQLIALNWCQEKVLNFLKLFRTGFLSPIVDWESTHTLTESSRLRVVDWE